MDPELLVTMETELFVPTSPCLAALAFVFLSCPYTHLLPLLPFLYFYSSLSILLALISSSIFSYSICAALSATFNSLCGKEVVSTYLYSFRSTHIPTYTHKHIRNAMIPGLCHHATATHTVMRKRIKRGEMLSSI